MKRQSYRLQANADRPDILSPIKHPSFDVFRQQAHVLQNREKIARLLRLFSSPRKRLGLTPDELLIFFAIGYLGTRITGSTIQVIPIGIIDVSALLGIPKETVRRKTIRLVDLDYVQTTPKGVLVKEIKVWCQMLERAVA
ncbi:hypothetical protein [Bradyrhizobium ganzhouense]|uniref:hypothetical protein n=1 Tax=Bradyrhizobium ganzhouense TaxID=1179767 RepID=UPI003CE6ABC3